LLTDLVADKEARPWFYQSPLAPALPPAAAAPHIQCGGSPLGVRWFSVLSTDAIGPAGRRRATVDIPSDDVLFAPPGRSE